MAQGTRIKDIATTATTEAADDFYVMDGATNGTRKIAKANAGASAISTHNDSQSAHGFGVYTVAQLNAFTDANRPTGVVLCSDNLTPEGVGSPVVWHPTLTKWLCTCSRIEATTDFWTYFESIAASGKDFLNSFGVGQRINGLATTAISSGSSVSISYNGESVEWATGTASATAGRHDAVGTYGVLKNPSTALVPKQVFFTRTIRVSALSAAGNDYHVRFGFLNATAAATQGAYEFAAYYDPANTWGFNPGASQNLFAVTREASANTVTDTGTAMPTLPANSVKGSFLIDYVANTCAIRINGAAVTIPQTTLPTANSRFLLPGGAFISTTGTTNRTLINSLGYWGVRY